MLDLGSISFVISTEAAKAFAILVVKRTKLVQSKDIAGKLCIPEDCLWYHLDHLIGITDPSMLRTAQLM
jgi:hypothetical protein